jgi:putative endonuclease
MSRVRDKPYFLYVLWSSDSNRFYIGITESIEQRLHQHNSGQFPGWTKRYQGWTLVHSERYNSYTEARRRELDLKRQKGGEGFYAKTGLDPGKFRRS